MPGSILLNAAEEAVSFADKVISEGADNWPEHFAELHRRHPDVPLGIDALRERREAADSIFYGDLSWIDDHSNPLHEHMLLQTAVDAMASGEGRCDEFAAVAYYHLAKKQRLTGVGYFGLTRLGAPPDDEFGHAFVLVGLDLLPMGSFVLSPMIVPPGWINAVWCDAWAKQCFEIRQGWPDRFLEIVDLVSGNVAAKRDGITVACRYYNDGTNSFTSG